MNPGSNALAYWRKHAGSVRARLGVVYGGEDSFVRAGVRVTSWRDAATLVIVLELCPEIRNNYAVSPDGMFLINTLRSGAAIPTFRVVLNWQSATPD